MPNVKYYLGDIEGNIIVKTCDNSVHSSKRHFHSEISIALIESGRSTVEVGLDHYDITDKTFLIIPEKAVHSCQPYDLNKWKFRMLYINRKWFNAIFNKSNTISFSYMKLNVKDYNKILRIFIDMEKGVFDMEKKAQLTKYISMVENAPNSLENALYAEPMKIIKNFIDENYIKDISLSDLEEISNISKYSIIREFNLQYGLAPHQYITNNRINFSKTLLKRHLAFADIALQSGFYDQSHFTKCFKYYTGVTPKQYIVGRPVVVSPD